MVAAEFQSYADQAQVHGMQQIDDLIYYDSNSDGDDENDDDTFHGAIQVEDAIKDTNDDDATIYGDPMNNEFIAPVGQEDRATGVTIKHEGVLHTQYCHYGKLHGRGVNLQFQIIFYFFPKIIFIMHFPGGFAHIFSAVRT